MNQSKPCNRIAQKIFSPEKVYVSRSYMVLWLPEQFWCKPQNRQLGPKSPIMTENHNGAQLLMKGQNSNAYSLYVVGKEILPGLLLY